MTAEAAATDDIEWNYDFELLSALGTKGLSAYAERQLLNMNRRYASRENELKLARVSYFYAVGKAAEAEKNIISIPQKHPVRPQALLLKGLYSTRMAKYQDAEIAFGEYFRLIPDPPSRKHDKAAYLEAINCFHHVLKELGKGQEAAELFNKMPVSDMDERIVMLLKLQAIIDAEENNLENNSDINHAQLDLAIKNLWQLQFQRDGASALAYIQVARTQTLKGFDEIRRSAKNHQGIAAIQHFRDAIRTLQTVEEFIQEIDDNNPSSPPIMPEAILVKSCAYRGQSAVTAAKGNSLLAARQLSKGAVGLLKIIRRKYRKTDTAKKLTKQFILCEECNKTWQLNQSIDMDGLFARDSVDAQFEAAEIIMKDRNDFREAARLFKQAIDKNIHNPHVLDNLSSYLRCLVMTDQYQEAKLFLERLHEIFPKNDAAVGTAAFTLGAWIGKRIQEASSPNAMETEQKACRSWAWELFLNLYPAHPQAPQIAFTIAQQKFSDTVHGTISSNTQTARPQPGDSAIRQCLPPFQRLADSFPSHPKGRLGRLRLAQLHILLKDYHLAAIHLKKYLSMPDGNAPDDMLEATRLLADTSLRSGQPSQALEACRQLIHITDIGKSCSNLAKTADAREFAAVTLPDAIDRETDSLSFRIHDIQERSRFLSDMTHDIDTDMRNFNKSLELNNLELNQSQSDLNELCEILESFELDFHSKAAAQAKVEAAKANAQKTEAEFITLFETSIRSNFAMTLQTIADAVDSKRAEINAAEQRNELQMALDKQLADELEDTNSRTAQALKQLQEKLEKSLIESEKASEALATVQSEIQRLTDIIHSSENDDELKTARASLKKLRQQLPEIEQRNYSCNSMFEKQQQSTWATEINNRKDDEAFIAWKQKCIEIRRQISELHNQLLPNARTSADTLSEVVAAARKAVASHNSELLRHNNRIKALGNQTAAELRKDYEAKISALQRIKDILTKASNDARAFRSVINEKQMKASEELKLINNEWRLQKVKAAEAYIHYLEQYPSGKNFARAVTALSAILIDLERYPEAVRRLTELVNGKVPECHDASPSCNPAKTATALCSLAMAQIKAGSSIQAAATCRRLLNGPSKAVGKAVDALPIGKLFFLAEHGTEIGAPEAAMAVCDMIINRIRLSAPDVAKIQPALCERLFIKAAEAALRSNEPLKTRKFISELLVRNPRTAFRYDAKCLEARALASEGNLDDAVAMINQLLRKITDSSISNRLRCCLAQIYLDSQTPEHVRQALSLYELICAFAVENAELDAEWPASPEARSNKESLEKAFAGAAAIYRSLSEHTRLKKLTEAYHAIFPQGTVL